MANDSLGVLSLAAFMKSRGLYGAGPAISYPESPGGSSLASGHQIPFKSESITEGISVAKDGSLVGGGREKPAGVTKREFSGTLTSNLWWCGLERLVMCALGFEMPDDSPVDVGSLGSVYAHIFERDEALHHQAWKSAETGTYTPPSANDRKVRSGMLGLYKEQWTGGDDWVFQGVMIDKITISGSPDGIEVSFDVIAHSVNTGSYNSTNWTLPGNSTAMAIWPQITFEIGAQSAGYAGLATMDINSFELTLANNLESEQSAGSGENIIQPARSDFCDVSLKITFPRYTSSNGSDTLVTLAGLDAALIGMLKFTGPEIGSTGYYRQWGFYMPWMKATDDLKANIDGPGTVKPEFSFGCFRPDDDDAFETDGTEYHGVTLKKDSELVVVVQNENSDNYLIES